jgi:hypothetical protein
MLSKLLIRISLVLLCSAHFGTFAQSSEDVLFLYGSTTEYHTGAQMPLVNVLIKQDGEKLSSLRTGRQGRYEVVLDLGFKYHIYFEKDGFFPKHYVIDTSGMTEEQQLGGFTFDVDISMIPKTKGLDLAICEEPISIATFDAEQNQLTFDAEMAQKYADAVDNAINKRSEKSR